MVGRRFEKEEEMPVKLDHTIVTARDKTESATFLAEVLGLGTPVATGHFLAVALDNGLTLDFCSVEEGAIRPQHFAFEVSEAEFDSVLGRVKERSVAYWADPRQTRPGEVDQRGNGRAIYFADPSGHWLEVLTRN
jgi:catechol 2,3-dioxygenase-like lactoylglutathione lyase family enzyme